MTCLYLYAINNDKYNIRFNVNVIFKLTIIFRYIDVHNRYIFNK